MLWSFRKLAAPIAKMTLADSFLPEDPPPSKPVRKYCQCYEVVYCRFGQYYEYNKTAVTLCFAANRSKT